MLELDQRIRQGLERLAPSVPSEGVYERVHAEYQRRGRRRRITRRAAVAAMASAAALVGFVLGTAGDGGGPNVVTGDPNQIPRFVTTWLPEGYQLRSVHERRGGANDQEWLREQLFEETDDDGNPTWQLRVTTRAAPDPEHDRSRRPVTVRGGAGQVSGDGTTGTVSVVTWQEDGRYYRASGYGLTPERTLRLVETMTIRTSEPAGVELPGREPAEDFDPHVAYPDDWVWADYTFTRGGDLDGFSIHVHSGLGVQATVEQPGDRSVDVVVRDRPGRLTTRPVMRLTWWEEPDVRISINILPRDELFAVAAGLQQVDEGTWEDYVASGSHQPVVEATGTLGDIHWARNRQPNGHTYVAIDVHGNGTSIPADDLTMVMPFQLDGRWWTFATADYEIVAIRFAGPDGGRDELASELPGAWTPPKRLYVVVTEDQPAWQTISAVLPDGTTRVLLESVHPQPGRDG